MVVYHRDDPDDKLILIPDVGPVPNPLVMIAGTLREVVRTRRRKWIVLCTYSVVATSGVFETMGPALIGLVIVVLVQAAIEILTGFFVRR
jgi:hypothetical protein